MFGIVVADDLSIKVRNNHMSSTSLSQSLVRTIATNSIVAMDSSFSVFINPCDKIEGIIGEKSSSV